MYDIALVVIVALVTLLTRFLPFWIFGKGKTPRWLENLGKVLPYAIIGMLVVYCLKDVELAGPYFGAPQLIGCAAVALLHIWKRNTLLSIGGGTLCYMLLVQFVFV